MKLLENLNSLGPDCLTPLNVGWSGVKIPGRISDDLLHGVPEEARKHDTPNACQPSRDANELLTLWTHCVDNEEGNCPDDRHYQQQPKGHHPLRYLPRPPKQQELCPSRDMGKRRTRHQVGPVELEEIRPDAFSVLPGGEPPKLIAPGHRIRLAPDRRRRVRVVDARIRSPDSVHEATKGLHRPLLTDAVNQENGLLVGHGGLPRFRPPTAGDSRHLAPATIPAS